MCRETGWSVWRNEKEKKKEAKKANVKIGSIGGGNVGLGNVSSGVTTISSLTTNIGTSGATTVNVGATGTTGGSVVNIGLGATGINIGTGSTGTVTIGNANGVVRLNGPLTLGSAPTSGNTGQLGSIVSSTMPADFGLTNGASSNVTSLALTPGIYIISYQLNIAISGTATYGGASVCVNNTSTPLGLGTNTVSAIQNNYNLSGGGYNPFYFSNSTNFRLNC